jgi:hypothetical protein
LRNFVLFLHTGISKSRYRTHSLVGYTSSSSSIHESTMKKKRNATGLASGPSAVYESGRRLEPLKEATTGRQITVQQASDSCEDVIKHDKHSVDA